MVTLGAIFLLDEALVDELLSSSTFRFWRTGADNHCILPEEDEEFDVHSLLTYKPQAPLLVVPFRQFL